MFVRYHRPEIRISFELMSNMAQHKKEGRLSFLKPVVLQGDIFRCSHRIFIFIVFGVQNDSFLTVCYACYAPDVPSAERDVYPRDVAFVPRGTHEAPSYR